MNSLSQTTLLHSTFRHFRPDSDQDLRHRPKHAVRTRLSIELIPRDLPKLQAQAETLANAYSALDTVNIPDIRRFDHRSWEACTAVSNFFANRVPHLRTCDFEGSSGRDRLSRAVESFPEILLVSGDPAPGQEPRRNEGHNLKTIEFIASRFPEKKIYAALDPYRRGMHDEVDYLRRKQESGITGVFTQPFFSLDYIKAWKAVIPESLKVFWGLSPVTTEKSRAYWTRVNKVCFPANFQFTLEHNQEFARDALRQIRHWQDNLYFMPIRINPERYLRSILPCNPKAEKTENTSAADSRT